MRAFSRNHRTLTRVEPLGKVPHRERGEGTEGIPSKSKHDVTSSRHCIDITMSENYHQEVRTTLTLDDDVAAKLKAETKRTGKPLRHVVNEHLRRSLFTKMGGSSKRSFRVRVRDMGALRPGLSLDNIGELLERIEGPAHL